MKPATPWMTGLLLTLTAVTLNGCMETLEFAGNVAAIAAGDSAALEEEQCDPAPASCRKSRPQSAELHILVSTPLPTLVTVYHGDFENGRVAWSGPPRGTSFSVGLPLGAYSATATYERGRKTVIAVDGDDLDYSVTDYCDGSCYETVDGAADLELE